MSTKWPNLCTIKLQRSSIRNFTRSVCFNSCHTSTSLPIVNCKFFLSNRPRTYSPITRTCYLTRPTKSAVLSAFSKIWVKNFWFRHLQLWLDMVSKWFWKWFQLARVTKLVRFYLLKNNWFIRNLKNKMDSKLSTLPQSVKDSKMSSRQGSGTRHLLTSYRHIRLLFSMAQRISTWNYKRRLHTRALKYYRPPHNSSLLMIRCKVYR